VSSYFFAFLVAHYCAMPCFLFSLVLWHGVQGRALEVELHGVGKRKDMSPRKKGKKPFEETHKSLLK